MNARAKWLALAAGLVVLGVLWQVQAADRVEVAPAKVQKLSDILGGETRYLTHVSTDKPVYRPGETVYARGVLLHHLTNQPMQQTASAAVEVIGPKGDVVASGHSQSQDSVLAFSWKIPSGQAGGEYMVKISHPWLGDAPAERKFDIRAYRAPRLKSQIKFLRDGYGPGDKVAATLEVTRAEGGIPADAKVEIIARIDGQEAYRGTSKVDAHGRCIARFRLPNEITRGEGSLAMVIEDGGVVETASKTIPILLQTVDLTMYPEGGDLVAGAVNRVYFEAFTPAKKPADLEGVVVDSAGRTITTFRSRHEGRGRFVFKPKKGEKYALKITQPAGIKSTYPLPEAKADGVSFWSRDNTFKDKVQFGLASSTARQVTVTLAKRGKELARQDVAITPAKNAGVEFSPGDAAGALVATVWDADGKPLAERLVFVHPKHGVQVKIEADQTQYVPGGKAKLTITTVDEAGEPTSAVVGVTVTDDSVLEMIERREQSPRLPVTVLLESDVKELADAHIYLDDEQEVASLAVDLLLGTQGWRRFAFVDTAKFIEQHGDDARRALALRLVSRREERKRGDELRALPELAIRAAAIPPAADVPAEEQENKKEKDLEKHLGQAEGQGQGQGEGQKLAELQAGRRPAAKPQPADREKQVGERQQLAQALKNLDAKKRDALFENGRRLRRANNDFTAIRIYAHQLRPDRQPGERRDFTETLYWNAGLKTDEKGQATIEFATSDSVTSFRVFADAFNSKGALGSGNTTTIESVEPFYVEPKLPLEVAYGDYIFVPVSLANATASPLQAGVKVEVKGFEVADADDKPIELPANERVRQLVKLVAGKVQGPAEFALSATAGPYVDKVARSVMIQPLGFPMERGRGGLIGAGETITYEIEIPETIVTGSANARAVVYPTPLASMTEALQRLIRDPNGCFEQTSSSTYPLVMAQQYFMSHQGVDPSLVQRSAEKLEKGYQRLIGFECKSGGYEWFGKDPGHDALTAYGLLEFTDMAKVREVDSQMIARTRDWLLKQRNGKGGFERKTHTYHTWLAKPEVSNTYNVWALLEAGIDADLSTEVKWIHDAAGRTENTYVMALAANVFSLAGFKEGEEHMLDKLAGLQQEDGSLRGATVSVVGSGGEALKIETTALAVTAWLKNKHYVDQVEKSIKFLAETCKSGRFGSTQSTVLALRAIVAYDQSRATPKADGQLQLIVDGKPLGDPVKFDKDTQGAIELPSFVEQLTAGKHKVQIEMTGGSKMPFSVAVNYHDTKPASSEECKLHVDVKLAEAAITEGELTEAKVTVINRTGETVPTPVAIVGIPGGLEVRHDQLKELVKAEKIAAYEVIGRDLVLYWRGLEAERRVDLPVSLVAAIPGRFTGPASRAYLYYTDEHKQWVDGLTVDIAPRD